MNKFKDFVYNKNDIIVALIILVIALAIIAFRIVAIMEYPKTLAAEQEKQIQTVQQDESSSQSDKK